MTLGTVEYVKLTSYEILPPTETFLESLQHYFPDKPRQEKIIKRIQDMLSIRPYHYDMFFGNITVSGVNLAGLRHMKVGVEGVKGGAVVYYRICEECKKNGYDMLSDIRCGFCDEKKGKHINLYLVRPRSRGY